MIEILRHLLYIQMYCIPRISIHLVYEVYIRSCRISAINNMTPLRNLRQEGIGRNGKLMRRGRPGAQLPGRLGPAAMGWQEGGDAEPSLEVHTVDDRTAA